MIRSKDQPSFTLLFRYFVNSLFPPVSPTYGPVLPISGAESLLFSITQHYATIFLNVQSQGLIDGTGCAVIGWVVWVSNMIPNALGILPQVRDE